MPLDIGDKFLVTFVGELDSQTTLSTFKYVCTAVTGAPSDITAQDALYAKLNTIGELVSKYNGCTSTQFLLKEMWIQKVFPIRLRKQVYVVNESGLFGDDQGTANIAGVITRTGGLGERNNISSLHIPIGTGTQCINNGVIQIDLKAAMIALVNKLIVSVVTTTPAATYSPSIWGKDPSASPVPIVTGFPQDTVRVMRRRTVGLGI